ncbi:two-component system sensor histidine kinase NreB/nitrogen regulatory protein A [Bacillus fengqiuensis]|nr:two-component system sensor histidine kinase NreB/nitrogen regulatory protein A [Bacillus fengqiuensis]
MAELRAYEEIGKLCDQLLNDIGCDFVGLAIQNQIGPDIRWHYAAGNRNDKFKRITVRYGKGIAGRVISTGTAMMITNFPNAIYGKTIEYPIMLAEQLISSYAVPIFYNGVPKGVLLVGRRQHYSFPEMEQKKVQQAARCLEGIL